MRSECLDHVPTTGERCLHRVAPEQVDYFNHVWPHQGIAQKIPGRIGFVSAGHCDGVLSQFLSSIDSCSVRITPFPAKSH